MSTAGELLWQMLPPRTASFEQLVFSAVLEPCVTAVLGELDLDSGRCAI
jgi:hypothetical protein